MPMNVERARLSRAMTFFWALLLFVLALMSRGGGHVVEVGLSIASVAYGALLGVFLLGTLTKSATETGAMIGMIGGLVANILLWKQPLVPLPKDCLDLVRADRIAAYVCSGMGNEQNLAWQEAFKIAVLLLVLLASQLKAQDAGVPANRSHRRRRDRGQKVSRGGGDRRSQRPHHLSQGVRKQLPHSCARSR